MEEGDLTTEEKLALMGLLKGYKTMHDDPPTLTEPNFLHTSIRAGKLRINHPDPQPSRRPNQIDLASGGGPILPPFGPEPESGTPKSRARHAGQPVFLGLTLKLEEEPYAWLWRDKAGKFVNPKQGEPPLTTLAARSMVDVAIQRFLGYGFWRLSASISTSFISQSSIIQDSIIINPDISIINIKTAEPTTLSSAYDELQRHIKTEPVPRIESGIKRELTTQRDVHSKTEVKISLVEDDDIIFIGAKLLSSAPAPGRCSCRGLCNHYVATIRAPAPAPTPATIHTPAPAMAVQQKSVASSSRTLEDISLISDSEGDDDFPSLPTRKDKERARVQASSPRQRFLRSDHGR
ncbi:hypothetical protein CDV36_015913 [Fusarium kuroshium]|uniref:Uncharacterized protein n=1 Tax=Fusarium kuroshium TaxID=2010991 RepID=A0A3M2R5I5_9HYPO|nr:hypothetical protein CDV36_015913 [Fusarium kuroshium]